jgi:hypothetical protein
LLAEAMDQDRIVEEEPDLRAGCVLGDEPVTEYEGERTASCVLPEDVSDKPSPCADARIEREERIARERGARPRRSAPGTMGPERRHRSQLGCVEASP